MEFQYELIIPNEGFPFKLFLFEGRNGNYVREKHWHTSIEIFAGMEGSLYFYIDEKEYPLKAGEFLIINSNEVHSIQAPVRNETIVLQIPLKQFSDILPLRGSSVFGAETKCLRKQTGGWFL